MIKRVIKKVIKKTDNVLFQGKLKAVYDYIKSKNEDDFFHKKKSILILEPVSDIILMQFNSNESFQYQFYDMAVRCLAVENYYGKNDFGFELYKKMHVLGGNYGEENFAEDYYHKQKKKGKNARYGLVKEEHSINQFINLIRSFEERGYDSDSAIMCDKNLLNMNGSHRLTLAYYRKLDFINVNVKNEAFPRRRFNLDWFWEAGFTMDELQLIKKKMEEIISDCRQRTGDYYCILFPGAYDYFDDITNDISEYDKENVQIVSYKDYEWEVAEFEGFLRTVYSFDSITSENFERKLYYILRASTINDGKVKFRILSIRMQNPLYRLKKDNGMPEPLTMVRLKNVIRNRYKTKEKKFTEHYIGDYDHDVIIHSTDNYLSNTAFRELLSVPKDLTPVFEYLNTFDYVIAETSNDKVSRYFPRNYYYDEDFDIFVRLNYVDIIQKKVHEITCNIFKDCKEILVINETTPEGKKRVRVNYRGITLTMFDFMTSVDGINASGIHKFFMDKSSDKYHFLSKENEIVYRTNEYLKNPSKHHHKEFLSQNKELIDSDRLCMFFDEPQRDKAIKLWKSL